MEKIKTTFSDDSYEIWMMANATKRGDTRSDYHIDKYEKQIVQLRRLIDSAKKRMETL